MDKEKHEEITNKSRRRLNALGEVQQFIKSGGLALDHLLGHGERERIEVWLEVLSEIETEELQSLFDQQVELIKSDPRYKEFVKAS